MSSGGNRYESLRKAAAEAEIQNKEQAAQKETKQQQVADNQAKQQVASEVAKNEGPSQYRVPSYPQDQGMVAQMTVARKDSNARNKILAEKQEAQKKQLMQESELKKEKSEAHSYGALKAEQTKDEVKEKGTESKTQDTEKSSDRSSGKQGKDQDKSERSKRELVFYKDIHPQEQERER